MNKQVEKLRHFFDASIAQKLVDAGLETPRKIKAAKDADLKAIKGVGDATVAAVRGRLGQG